MSVHGIISIASSIVMELTVIVNLHFSGILVPSVASWDIEAAPSQYHKRRQLLRVTSQHSRCTSVPKNTPLRLPRTITFLFVRFSI